MKNAVSALLTVTTTIKALKVASLAVNLLSLKKALLNAHAEVLSALTLLKTLLAAAVVAMFSRPLKAKSLEMSVITPIALKRPSRTAIKVVVTHLSCPALLVVNAFRQTNVKKLAQVVKEDVLRLSVSATVITFHLLMRFATKTADAKLLRLRWFLLPRLASRDLTTKLLKLST